MRRARSFWFCGATHSRAIGVVCFHPSRVRGPPLNRPKERKRQSELSQHFQAFIIDLFTFFGRLFYLCPGVLWVTSARARGSMARGEGFASILRKVFTISNIDLSSKLVVIRHVTDKALLSAPNPAPAIRHINVFIPRLSLQTNYAVGQYFDVSSKRKRSEAQQRENIKIIIINCNKFYGHERLGVRDENKKSHVGTSRRC